MYNCRNIIVEVGRTHGKEDLITIETVTELEEKDSKKESNYFCPTLDQMCPKGKSKMSSKNLEKSSIPLSKGKMVRTATHSDTL